jgi:hypothetical protein
MRVAGMRFETVAAVRRPLDADDRQYDHCRRLGGGVDRSAAARARCLVWKADNFAHCSPSSAPATLFTPAGSAHADD